MRFSIFKLSAQRNETETRFRTRFQNCFGTVLDELRTKRNLHDRLLSVQCEILFENVRFKTCKLERCDTDQFGILLCIHVRQLYFR